jgi:hypothetical protein
VRRALLVAALGLVLALPTIAVAGGWKSGSDHKRLEGWVLVHNGTLERMAVTVSRDPDDPLTTRTIYYYDFDTTEQDFCLRDEPTLRLGDGRHAAMLFGRDDEWQMSVVRAAPDGETRVDVFKPLFLGCPKP